MSSVGATESVDPPEQETGVLRTVGGKLKGGVKRAADTVGSAAVSFGAQMTAFAGGVATLPAFGAGVAAGAAQPVKNAGLALAASASQEHEFDSRRGLKSRLFGDNGVEHVDIDDYQFDASDRPWNGAEDVAHALREGHIESRADRAKAAVGVGLAGVGEVGVRGGMAAMDAAYAPMSLAEGAMDVMDFNRGTRAKVETAVANASNAPDVLRETGEMMSNTLRTGTNDAEFTPAEDARPTRLPDEDGRDALADELDHEVANDTDRLAPEQDADVSVDRADRAESMVTDREEEVASERGGR